MPQKTMRNLYEDIAGFASLAGIAPRVARRIFAAFANGRTKPWHGAVLDVRQRHGRGGRGGAQYEVAVSSLPVHLQTRWHELQGALKPVSNTLPMPVRQAGRTAWWLNLLKPVLDAEAGTPKRTQAYDAILSRPLTDWKGRPFKTSLRTLQRRVEKVELEGIAGLAPIPRQDRGAKRYFVTKAWDDGVPFNDDLKRIIADQVIGDIRALIKNGAQTSKVRILARETLIKLTKLNGFAPNDPAELDRICGIPAAMVHAEARYKKVWRYRHDRKAHNDAAPRIRRTTNGLEPMEILVGDVHHINVLLPRSNGKTATAKLLAFMDVATRRIWCDLILIEKRGGVRNVDQIEVFADMAQYPAWGVPSLIYVDNGTEYLFADYLDTALQLKVTGQLPGGERKSRVIRALPYNAAAKPIEGWFGHFEQHFLQHLQGYIGDDRMNPKSPHIGKLPKPFSGGFDAFKTRFFELLFAYEAFPQGGALKGKSPAETFRDYVKHGWQATVMKPDDLNSVFVKRETRKLQKGTVSVGGRYWTCDELAECLDDTVIACIPVWHGYNELRIEDRRGKFVAIARPDEEHDFHDERGAKKSAGRKSNFNKALTRLASSAPETSVGDRLVAFGRDQMPVIPNAPIATISVTPDGPASKVAPSKAVRPKSRDDEEREHARRVIAFDWGAAAKRASE